MRLRETAIYRHAKIAPCVFVHHRRPSLLCPVFRQHGVKTGAGLRFEPLVARSTPCLNLRTGESESMWEGAQPLGKKTDTTKPHWGLFRVSSRALGPFVSDAVSRTSCRRRIIILAHGFRIALKYSGDIRVLDLGHVQLRFLPFSQMSAYRDMGRRIPGHRSGRCSSWCCRRAARKGDLLVTNAAARHRGRWRRRRTPDTGPRPGAA